MSRRISVNRATESPAPSRANKGKGIAMKTLKVLAWLLILPLGLICPLLLADEQEREQLVITDPNWKGQEHG